MDKHKRQGNAHEKNMPQQQGPIVAQEFDNILIGEQEHH